MVSVSENVKTTTVYACIGAFDAFMHVFCTSEEARMRCPQPDEHCVCMCACMYIYIYIYIYIHMQVVMYVYTQIMFTCTHIHTYI